MKAVISPLRGANSQKGRMTMATAFIRTIVLYFLIMVGLRLLGKRQIGELEPIELVLTLLTFTQVPCVLLLLRLFPFSILLKEVCDLLWHRYLLTIVDDNDVVVHLCPFRFRRKGTHPRCRNSAKNCRPSWSILRTGVVIMPYGAHECLRPHLRCGPHRKAARFGFRLLPI